MPIPLLISPAEQKINALQLARNSGPEALPKRPLHLLPRALAHAFDLGVVLGISLYVSRLASLVFLSYHMKDVQGSGRLAQSLFHDLRNYGQGQVFFACLALFGLAYFVGLPLWRGNTLGYGLCGLKVEAGDGSNASPRAHGLRFLGCTLAYATGGLLPLAGLRAREGRLFQDYFTGTRVVKED